MSSISTEPRWASVDDELRDYAVEIRIRNARILGLMRRAGIATAGELAKLAHVGPSELGKLINLKATPLDAKTGDYKKTVQRIANALNCHPDDMFTDRQRHTFMASNRRCVEMSEAEVDSQLAALQQISPEEHMERIERRDAIKNALAILTSKQRNVIILRFGLGGDEPKTLDQVAETYNSSRERIRQLENRALERLSDPRLQREPRRARLRSAVGLDPVLFDVAAFKAHEKMAESGS